MYLNSHIVVCVSVYTIYVYTSVLINEVISTCLTFIISDNEETLHAVTIVFIYNNSAASSVQETKRKQELHKSIDLYNVSFYNL